MRLIKSRVTLQSSLVDFRSNGGWVRSWDGSQRSALAIHPSPHCRGLANSRIYQYIAIVVKYENNDRQLDRNNPFIENIFQSFWFAVLFAFVILFSLAGGRKLVFLKNTILTREKILLQVRCLEMCIFSVLHFG